MNNQPKLRLEKRFIFIILFSTFSFAFSTKGYGEYFFLPAPQQVSYSSGIFKPKDAKFLWIDSKSYPELLKTAKIAVSSLQSANYSIEITAAKGTQIAGSILIDKEQVEKPDGYKLSIKPNQIEIVANSPAGAFYAVQTLKQICQQAEPRKLKCLTVNDWPDFPNRGIMTDVARDKVPTMESLYELVDMMASWKLNQLQLYTEHTFAYRNHKTVWQDASPMTAQQILELDEYCRKRYIELVPNQNSFGHMERWLKHPEYKHLAEVSGGGTICPVEPRSIKLLEEMYDELLPHFSSKQVNVGCDETQIGNGKSKQACEQKGNSRVYLDFLHDIHNLVRKHDKIMQFWGDIILHKPELIQELPDNITAMVWGYEANHPFDDQCQKFKESGVPFYVCPGTSSWNSISGRTDNAMTNLLNAAENGIKHGAIGYLNTNWGDGGHWQPFTSCLPAYAYGAAVNWAVKTNKNTNITKALDLFVFDDKTGIMGKVIYDLGNVYKLTGTPNIHNNSFLNWLLHDHNLTSKRYKYHDTGYFENTIGFIDDVVSRIEKSKMGCRDKQLYIDEVKQAAALLRHSCNLAIAQLQTESKLTKDISKSKREALAVELENIIKEHKRIWLKRNRIGGLSDSAARLENLLKVYNL
ncbi:family 20 glycosylhydrolase [Seonamhaeicola sp.]|uniref:family 20 glycosylhydrolase n=1 Tax=Seonamhaeicola sp. TaxID=1912245 RepID=UPI00261433B5|nr:family 20 glycosylhydrolase [Seonamhaeicola sp.]